MNKILGLFKIPISSKRQILILISLLGKLLALITFFIKKKYIIFISNSENEPLYNHLIFENKLNQLINKNKYNFKIKYIIKKPRTINNYFDSFIYLIKAKLIIYSIPSDLLLFRKLFGARAKKILIHGGIAIKSGGFYSKHFTEDFKKFYCEICSDVDYFCVGSKLESYITSSALSINPSKIFILKNNYKKFSNQELSQKQLIKLRKKYKKIIAYYPTHRDHLQNNLPTLFPLINDQIENYLIKEKILILYNLHPIDENQYSFKSSKNMLMMNNLITDSQDILDQLDGLITDYSGIYLKVLNNFNVALGFIHTDLKDYEKDRGLILDSNILFPSNQIFDSDQLYNFIESVPFVAEYEKERRRYLFNLFSDNKENMPFEKLFI